MFQSLLLQTLSERGFIHQCTHPEELDALAKKKSITFYLGIDVTAPSLHVGNLVPLMAAHFMQKAGHTPIILLGGGTTKVGDPSGKDKERPLLDSDTIDQNTACMKNIFKRFLSFSGNNAARIMNNDSWLSSLHYIELLREIGPHISINRMLSFDSIKSRLDREQSLSVLEFNYMLCQAYDFLRLFDKETCLLQIGGSDQWGNIICGIDLIHKRKSARAFGLTVPLLTHANGKKMGKSETGAIWADRTHLEPFAYWQFWRNVADEDVERFLKIFTPLSLDAIKKLSNSINDAKRRLADEATSLAHGSGVIEAIHNTVDALYVKGNNLPPVTVTGTNSNGHPIIETSLPIIDLPSTCMNLPLYQLIYKSGLMKSAGECRKLIRNGGCRLQGTKQSDEHYILQESDYISSGVCTISLGKKKHYVLRFLP